MGKSRKSKSRPPAFCLSKQTSPQKSVKESTASHGLNQHVGVCGPSEGGQWNQPGQPARLIGIAERSPRRGGVGGRYSARLSDSLPGAWWIGPDPVVGLDDGG